MDHGEGNVGLDANDNCRGSAQLKHVGDRAKSARRKRINDIEHRDVDNDTLRTIPADPLGKIVSERQKVGVSEGGLNACNEVITLLEDRDVHALRR